LVVHGLTGHPIVSMPIVIAYFPASVVNMVLESIVLFGLSAGICNPIDAPEKYLFT